MDGLNHFSIVEVRLTRFVSLEFHQVGARQEQAGILGIPHINMASLRLTVCAAVPLLSHTLQEKGVREEGRKEMKKLWTSGIHRVGNGPSSTATLSGREPSSALLACSAWWS